MSRNLIGALGVWFVCPLTAAAAAAAAGYTPARLKRIDQSKTPRTFHNRAVLSPLAGQAAAKCECTGTVRFVAVRHLAASIGSESTIRSNNKRSTE